MSIIGSFAGGIDTSDATAAAGNIDSGKTAYVDGEKVTGTSVKVDSNDATASASEIKSGRTAYVKNIKVTGTSTAVETGDATATPSDIKSGKTAYVKGVKVTGTNTDVPFPYIANPVAAQEMQTGKQAAISPTHVITGTAVIPNYELFYTEIDGYVNSYTTVKIEHPFKNISGLLKLFGSYRTSFNKSETGGAFNNLGNVYYSGSNSYELFDLTGNDVRGFKSISIDNNFIYINGSNPTIQSMRFLFLVER